MFYYFETLNDFRYYVFTLLMGLLFSSQEDSEDELEQLEESSSEEDYL